MRLLFTWLLMFGVFAGICERALAADPCETLLKMHAQEHSDHHHDPSQPCDPSHDEKCPLDHHQQCHCGHSMPLADASDLLAGLAAPACSLSRFRPEGEVAPEGPCLSEDEPPLI